MLSLIIPCYNAARYSDATLGRLLPYLRRHFPSFELILVDDGSNDATLAHLKRWEGPSVKVLSLPKNRGKGAAVRRGVLAASGEYIVFTDADMPYGMDAFARLIAAMQEGHDVVLGARLDDGTVAGQKIHRTKLSRIFAALANVVLKESVPDTQAGIKGFTKRAAREIFALVTIPRFCFDVEAIAIAQAKGLKIASIPVELQNQEASTVKVGTDGLRMLIDLIFIFLKWRL